MPKFRRPPQSQSIRSVRCACAKDLPQTGKDVLYGSPWLRIVADSSSLKGNHVVVQISPAHWLALELSRRERRSKAVLMAAVAAHAPSSTVQVQDENAAPACIQVRHVCAA